MENVQSMGIGDLGIGDWPIPNPQSPIPNPQYVVFLIYINYILKIMINKIFKKTN